MYFPKFDYIWVIQINWPSQITYYQFQLPIFPRDCSDLHHEDNSFAQGDGLYCFRPCHSFHLPFMEVYYSQLGTWVVMNISFNPQTDDQFERTIQVLEDMLQTYVIDFGSQWGQSQALVEFAYNNSYLPSIKIETFEGFHDRWYISMMGWFDTFEDRPWVPTYCEILCIVSI